MTDRRLAERLRDGQRRHRRGDLSGALECYRQVLASRPALPEVLVLAATAATELGRLEDAERYARRAVHARPDAAANLTLGRVLLGRGELSDARAAFSAAAADPRLAGDSLFLRTPKGSGWRLRAAGAEISLEPSVYLGQSGAFRRGEQVVLSGRTEGASTTVKWALQREGTARK